MCWCRVCIVGVVLKRPNVRAADGTEGGEGC